MVQMTVVGRQALGSYCRAELQCKAEKVSTESGPVYPALVTERQHLILGSTCFTFGVTGVRR